MNKPEVYIVVLDTEPEPTALMKNSRHFITYGTERKAYRDSLNYDREHRRIVMKAQDYREATTEEIVDRFRAMKECENRKK